MNNKITAIIDLGSNSLRMTIAEIIPGAEIRELGDYRETVRISENMGPEKIIKEAAIIKTIAALHSFRAAMVDHSVQDVTAVATEALRKAANRETFIRRVWEETGILFRVISGEEEAKYAFSGATAGMEISDCLLMDTGGGSCELIHAVQGQIRNVISLLLGGVVLTEQFLEKDVISSSGLFRLFQHIHDTVMPVQWLEECRGLPVIAVGGSYKAIISMTQRTVFTRTDIGDIYNRFLQQNLEERRAVLVEYEDRADIIVGGLAPLIYITGRLCSDRIYGSTKGIRDGILANQKSESNV